MKRFLKLPENFQGECECPKLSNGKNLVCALALFTSPWHPVSRAALPPGGTSAMQAAVPCTITQRNKPQGSPSPPRSRPSLSPCLNVPSLSPDTSRPAQHETRQAITKNSTIVADGKCQAVQSEGTVEVSTARDRAQEAGLQGRSASLVGAGLAPTRAGQTRTCVRMLTMLTMIWRRGRTRAADLIRTASGSRLTVRSD